MVLAVWWAEGEVLRYCMGTRLLLNLRFPSCTLHRTVDEMKHASHNMHYTTITPKALLCKIMQDFYHQQYEGFRWKVKG